MKVKEIIKNKMKPGTGMSFFAKKQLVDNINKNYNVNLPPKYITLGSSGKGRVFHIWDNLKRCTCGAKPYIMRGDDELFCCGQDSSNVFVKCLKCGKHTEYNQISYAVNSWNCLIKNK